MTLRRFWFRFGTSSPLPPGLALGCGVTAYDYDDAVSILQAKVFASGSLPPLEEVIENIDVSRLDPGHVLPNMLAPSHRGIWFPMGYQ